jgi:nucleotide-binding universal stress UspA family protein
MDDYPRVLVGTDGSPDALAAVQLAAAVAARSGVPLVIVHVDDDDREPAGLLLAEAEESAARAGVGTVEVWALAGKAPEILLNLADEQPDQLVVVGSAGLSKASSRLVGSTSNRLTHHSLADVLFAKAPPPDAWNFVALSTDGSPTSLHAARHGLRIAAVLEASPRLVTAARSVEAGAEVLASAAAELGVADIEREVLVDPHPAGAVVNAGWKYELVVIGNRGMSGPGRLLGSVANTITHELRTNLLLVNTTRSS